MTETERVQIGWQSMSAVGGGGGMLTTFAGRQPFAEAVAATTAERGEPDHADDRRAVWSTEGGASTERLELYRPDAVPGHVPTDDGVPADAGHVRVEMSLYMRSASDAGSAGPASPAASIAGTPTALALSVVIALVIYAGYRLLAGG